jgi:hypothetical protein
VLVQQINQKGERKTMNKLMIWTDRLDEKWEEEYLAEHPDANDAEVYNAWYEYADMSFHDEKINLNIPIEGNVLIIRKVNRWNGTTVWCSIIKRDTIGMLLERCLDGNSFYVDADTGDFIGEAYHHDGTNYYRFREIPADALNDDIVDLTYKIDFGDEYEEDLLRLTKTFGGRIAKVYGWKVNATDE